MRAGTWMTAAAALLGWCSLGHGQTPVRDLTQPRIGVEEGSYRQPWSEAPRSSVAPPQPRRWAGDAPRRTGYPVGQRDAYRFRDWPADGPFPQPSQRYQVGEYRHVPQPLPQRGAWRGSGDGRGAGRMMPGTPYDYRRDDTSRRDATYRTYIRPPQRGVWRGSGWGRGAGRTAIGGPAQRQDRRTYGYAPAANDQRREQYWGGTRTRDPFDRSNFRAGRERPFGDERGQEFGNGYDRPFGDRPHPPFETRQRWRLEDEARQRDR